MAPRPSSSISDRVDVSEAPESTHECLSPHRLALRSATWARDADCGSCQASEEQLQSWLLVLRHSERLVASQFITRHELFFQLFTECQSPLERQQRIEDDVRFQHWGLGTLLLHGALEANGSPLLQHELQSLARAIVSRLNPEAYSKKRVSEFRERIQRSTP